MLGVKQNHVVLVPHDEVWADEYETTKKILVSILGDNAITLHHVGSTAIKGILAKPILDIAVEVEKIESLNIAGMEASGYEWCGDRAVKGDYLFVKRQSGDISMHHIHCYPKGSGSLKAAVLFCDYLNHNPHCARQYNELKEKLAARYPDDRASYTNGKSDFIERIISLAENERRGN